MNFWFCLIFLLDTSFVTADKFQEDALKGVIPIFPLTSFNAEELHMIADDTYILTPQLIEKHGYQVEIHNVTTPDGYILELHRIPKGNKKLRYDFKAGTDEKSCERSVVFLQHGLCGSSSDWVVAGPNYGLAYILADLNYDVWMGNARGNLYSRRHKKYFWKTDNYKFWDFTFHEVGYYDLPAMIDYVLRITQKQNINFIGHSLGATSSYVMCSELPEYNKKINLMFSLAPMAFMSGIQSPYLKIVQNNLKNAVKLIGTHEFTPNSTSIQQYMNEVEKTLKLDDPFNKFVGENTYFLTNGLNKNNINMTLLSVIMGHSAMGTSAKNIIHILQCMESGKFRKYDEALFNNLIKYWRPYPPSYDLSKITTPVAVFYSRNDWLSTDQDISVLHKQLNNSIGKYLIRDRKFTNTDFLWGLNAREEVYDKILKILNILC